MIVCTVEHLQWIFVLNDSPMARRRRIAALFVADYYPLSFHSQTELCPGARGLLISEYGDEFRWLSWTPHAIG